MMNLNALKIDPEFQGKIPPLNLKKNNSLSRTFSTKGGC